jgi:hypothetical protein
VIPSRHQPDRVFGTHRHRKVRISKRNKLALVWFFCRERMEAAGYFRRRPGFRPRPENAWAALPRGGASLSRLHDGCAGSYLPRPILLAGGRCPASKNQVAGRGASADPSETSASPDPHGFRMGDFSGAVTTAVRHSSTSCSAFGSFQPRSAVTLQPDFVVMLYRLHIDRT